MRCRPAVGWIGLAAVLALAACQGASATASGGHPAEPPASGRPTGQRAPGPPDSGGYVFRGWGTSLAWWAESAASWPGLHQILSDLFTAPPASAPAGTPGLGLTVLRYNLGASLAPGVQSPSCPLAMPPVRAVASLEPRPGQLAPDNDPGQEQVLADAAAMIRRAGQAPVVEAFANSPPWWLLSSRADPGQCPSGGLSGAPDLPLASSADMTYARYLATVTRLLSQQTGVAVNTIEPFNEPVTTSWRRGNHQEGSYIGPAQQAQIVTDLCRLRRGGAGISAPDTNTPAEALAELTASPMSAPAVRACLAQVNTHTYDGGQERPPPTAAVLAGLRQAAGKPVSMSEYGLGSPATVPPIAPALSLSLRIALTLNSLRPVDWVYWQVVEHGSGWGLIDDANPQAASPSSAAGLEINLRYWALDQYSRFIRPGSTILPVSGDDTVVARAPDGRYVVVLTNQGSTPRPFSVGLSSAGLSSAGLTGAGLTGAAIRGYQTTARGMRTTGAAPEVSGGRLRVTEPAQSITTYVLTS